MPLTANDNPVLVAPRPVRLNTLFTRSRMLFGSDHHERVRFADENSDIDDRKIYESSDKEISSQRSSPRSVVVHLIFALSHAPPFPSFNLSESPPLRLRSGLPTEALEEFLSILRPSFFPPPSPVLLTRRQGAVSLPTFQHERTYSFKGRGLLQQKNDLVDELEVSRSTQPSRNAHTPEEGDEFDGETLPVRWFSSNVLSSPISRMHTRNPFQRHSSYPGPVSPGPVSPIALSPAAIPLPLPTPDEMIEMSS
ncbi:hypothetical protein B0H17DRAFT_140431 [Mycena rosella]|uniref:Uncharacterized protein n=1 Tax=Mycena rosella TaxID=1033263 RepID=A0AAD7E0W4_MYCRO|nr:hypothetical protein B0H17DRAFT_140431 [Mycena rosella]